MKTSLPSAADPIVSLPVHLSKPLNVIGWVLRLLAAGILAQTLFFKFTGAEESVYIFTKVGLEPIGRYASGLAELIAAILLLVPNTVALGAALSLGVMAGAIFAHLTILGIDVMHDGGLLFGLAVAVFVAASILLIVYRRQLPVIGDKLR